MTKYILVGGYLSKATDGGRDFAEELVEGFGDASNILLCLYARPPATWPEILEKESASFRKYLPGKKLDIRSADPATFIEQVRWAHAIYIRGGITNMLLEALSGSPGWEDELDGKTLAGSSAGADIIAKYHYNLDTKRVGDGLGLLPIKVIPHWRSDFNGPEFDWDQAYNELKAHGEDLPVLTLAEGQFEVRTR